MSMNRIEAVVSPIRAAILVHMHDRHTKPTAPVELAEQLNISSSHSSYHVRVLANVGLLEMVSQEAVRGSLKHYYRVAPTAFVEPLISMARRVLEEGTT